jgi:hypothetical protein
MPQTSDSRSRAPKQALNRLLQGNRRFREANLVVEEVSDVQ